MEDDYVESVIADKEELHLTGSDGALFKVMGLIEIKRPSLSFNEEDDTDFDSGGIAMQIPGLGTLSALTAVIKYRPGSETDIKISEHLFSKEQRPGKIVSRAANDGSTQEATAMMRIFNYEENQVSTGGKKTATLTIRVREMAKGAVTPPPAA